MSTEIKSGIVFEFVTGEVAREIDHQNVAWPNGSAVLYAREDGEIVGRTGIIYLPHIEGTWVAESKRGGTLAFRLIKKLEEESIALGRTHLFAFVWDGQPEVAGYLQRVGFERFPVTVYCKPLPLNEEE